MSGRERNGLDTVVNCEMQYEQTAFLNNNHMTGCSKPSKDANEKMYAYATPFLGSNSSSRVGFLGWGWIFDGWMWDFFFFC